jgi:hypothetical protein
MLAAQRVQGKAAVPCPAPGEKILLALQATIA